LVLEAGGRLGGNHTWSFHDNDISPAARKWVAPFIAQSWPRQMVRFPKYSRTLSVGYNTISSETLHEAASAALGESVLLSVRVQDIAPNSVTLTDGRSFSARCVIDARRQRPGHGLTVAYQKFVGLEVRLEKPHGQQYPVIMDATLPQRD